jgi:hypothetical protein
MDAFGHNVVSHRRIFSVFAASLPPSSGGRAHFEEVPLTKIEKKVKFCIKKKQKKNISDLVRPPRQIVYVNCGGIS